MNAISFPYELQNRHLDWVKLGLYGTNSTLALIIFGCPFSALQQPSTSLSHLYVCVCRVFDEK
jgi:hypothetical protein